MPAQVDGAVRLKSSTAQSSKLENSARIFINLNRYDITHSHTLTYTQNTEGFLLFRSITSVLPLGGFIGPVAVLRIGYWIPKNNSNNNYVSGNT